MARPVILLTAAVLLAGCGASPTQDRVSAAKGSASYVRHCARCHLQDGSGVAGVYPNLAGNPIVRLDSAEPTINIVLKGREAMPAFGGQLPVNELAEIISYVRGAWGNDASAVTPAMVK